MTPNADVSMDSSFAGAALRSSFLSTEDRAKVEWGNLLEKLNRHEMKIRHLKILILKKTAAVKTKSTCLVDTEKKAAPVETGKGLLSNSNAEVLFSATLKWL